MGGTEQRGGDLHKRHERGELDNSSKIYLEVLVEEVEEQKDGDQEGQGKGGGDSHKDNGGEELQAAAQEESSKVCEVFVHVRRILGQAVDDSACWGHMEEGQRGPAVIKHLRLNML